MTTQDEAAVIFLKRLAGTLGVDADALNPEENRKSFVRDTSVLSLTDEQKIFKEKQILDSLRLLKAFLAIDDEPSRMAVLEFAERMSRRDISPDADT
ncbi:hypothetical protein [Methylobacterium soli]|uniref:Uncharacterized protein n=1 Tax=Methylobacterium soli TaxID=553447 RepID=A0A6L3SV75_9HYPH|nr:hypothetical protein [Methylobacterium soli]KAB1076768.1 hypothetical protein F6X53_22025 [Methylobacterium soli]GJE45164.1 hypothetical protein AEGHOMDF_4358 [Methylobacterium soli]